MTSSVLHAIDNICIDSCTKMVHHWWQTAQLICLTSAVWFTDILPDNILRAHFSCKLFFFPVLFFAKEYQRHSPCHLQDMITDIFTLLFLDYLWQRHFFIFSWDSFTDDRIQLRKSTVLVWTSVSNSLKSTGSFFQSLPGLQEFPTLLLLPWLLKVKKNKSHLQPGSNRVGWDCLLSHAGKKTDVITVFLYRN